MPGGPARSRWASAGGDMRWLLLLASVTTCVWARPSQRPSGDVEAQRLPRSVSCEDVNRTLADSARPVESPSSQPRSRQTANCSSKWTPGDTSREAPSASSLSLDSTSEDTAAFPGLSAAESDPVAVGVGFSSRGCSLATCSVADLGSKLQAGGETAGASTLDPDGFGKK